MRKTCCKIKKEKNECDLLFTETYIENGEIWLAGEHIDQRVNFCPICGRKADKQLDSEDTKQ